MENLNWNSPADEQLKNLPEVPAPTVPWGMSEALAMWVVFIVAQVITGFAAGLGYALFTGFGPGGHKTPPGWALMLSSAVSELAVLGIIWLMLRVSYAQPFGQGIHWEGKKKKVVKMAVTTGIAISLLNGLLGYFFPPQNLEKVPLYRFVSTNFDLAVFAVFAVLVAPFVEEFVFRGWILPAFEKKIGAAAAVVLTAVLFAAPHAFQLGSYFMGVLFIGILGIGTGVLRIQTGGVKAPILCHLVYNSMILLMEVFNRAVGSGGGM